MSLQVDMLLAFVIMPALGLIVGLALSKWEETHRHFPEDEPHRRR